MKDKIVVEKGFFVQLVVSLVMSYSFLQDVFQSVWRLPVMVFLVVVVNMYFNALAIAYKLKSRSLKLRWCFSSSFKFNTFSYPKR